MIQKSLLFLLAVRLGPALAANVAAVNILAPNGPVLAYPWLQTVTVHVDAVPSGSGSLSVSLSGAATGNQAVGCRVVANTSTNITCLASMNTFFYPGALTATVQGSTMNPSSTVQIYTIVSRPWLANKPMIINSTATSFPVYFGGNSSPFTGAASQSVVIRGFHAGRNSKSFYRGSGSDSGSSGSEGENDELEIAYGNYSTICTSFSNITSSGFTCQVAAGTVLTGNVYVQINLADTIGFPLRIGNVMNPAPMIKRGSDDANKFKHNIEQIVLSCASDCSILINSTINITFSGDGAGSATCSAITITPTAITCTVSGTLGSGDLYATVSGSETQSSSKQFLGTVAASTSDAISFYSAKWGMAIPGIAMSFVLMFMNV